MISVSYSLYQSSLSRHLPVVPPVSKQRRGRRSRTLKRTNHPFAHFFLSITTTTRKANNIPLHIKTQLLFESLCISILLYGCETWIINKTLIAKINSYATSCYRYILGIRRTDHIRNSDVLAILKKQPLSKSITSRQLSWLGHQLRREDEHPIKRFALYEPAHSKKKPGRPRLSYTSYATLKILLHKLSRSYCINTQDLTP